MRRYVNAPTSAPMSLSLKMLLLSIASFLVPTCLHQASAFAPPPRRAAQTTATLKPHHHASPTSPAAEAASLSIESREAMCNAKQKYMRSRHDSLGACTKLWANTANDDEETPKATSKGAQRPKIKAKQPAAKSKNKKTTARKSDGKRKESRQQKKKHTKKTPLEISTQSLSASQSKSASDQRETQNSQPTNPAMDEENYAYNIPTTGYSLADQLENKSPQNQEKFETTLTPIVVGIRDTKEKEFEFQYDEEGFPIGYTEVDDGKESEDDANIRPQHQGVARIDTVSTFGNAGEEPVRWLVSLGEAEESGDGSSNGDGDGESFVMIDLPPYSDKLANEIRSFMDPNYNATKSSGSSSSNKDQTKRATLDAILLTNQQCIHYDSSPAVYVTRKSDLMKWKKAFPTAEVAMYRLDIPRDCREEVTQVLDGYGPWGWEEDAVALREDNGEVQGSEDPDGLVANRRGKFAETGRPLTIEEWDDDTKSKVLTEGELPPDDQVVVEGNGGAQNSKGGDEDSDDPMYSPEAIRKREEKHRLLAVYTPGHTFGSVTYIFPRRGVCCSGYTLPMERSATIVDDRDYYDANDDNQAATTRSSTRAIPPQGPRLDYQGYLATSASRPRQMSSALSLINNYIDRFRVVLPARGDAVFLDSKEETRKRELMESVGLYTKIGEIYSRLGIVEKQ